MLESFSQATTDLDNALLIGMALVDKRAERQKVLERLYHSIREGWSKSVQFPEGCSRYWLPK